MRKLLKKLLAPIVREVVKEEVSVIREACTKMINESLEKAYQSSIISDENCNMKGMPKGQSSRI